MLKATAIPILSLTCVLSLSATADSVSSRLRSQGNELEYNLDLPAALNFFRQAIDAESSDPAAYRAVAHCGTLKSAGGQTESARQGWRQGAYRTS